MNITIQKEDKVLFKGEIIEAFGHYFLKKWFHNMCAFERLELCLIDETQEGVLEDIKTFCNAYKYKLDVI